MFIVLCLLWKVLMMCKGNKLYKILWIITCSFSIPDEFNSQVRNRIVKYLKNSKFVLKWVTQIT
jgi:hypothetical protein